jgi:ribonuclease P protein subunit POP4
MGIHDIPKSEQRYELYLGLHKLWMGYIQEILGIRSSTIAALGDAIANPTPNTFRGASTGTAAILTSADFHGAELEVVRSRCPSRVGLKGIVLRDSKFAFTLVTSKNEVKVCPKEHTVFRFRVEVPAWDDAGRNPEGDTTDEGDQKGSGKAVEERKLIFELHGEQFQHRAVDRANKKFKPHFLPDL